MSQIAITAALPFALIDVFSLIIALINSRRPPQEAGGSGDPTLAEGARRQRIGFGFRGVGFFSSQGNEVQDFGYAWPVFGLLSLGISILAVAIAFLAA